MRLNFLMKSDFFSAILLKMSVVLLKEINNAVNSVDAGRFTEMRRRREKLLKSTKNVQALTISNMQRESLSNGLQLPVDINYFIERLV